MKILHQASVILFFVLIVGFMGIQPVGATGGGSFEIPDINDDFNQVEQGPAPAKERPITESRQEKGFFDKVGDFFSGTWEKTKTGIKKATDWTASIAKDAWDWLTSKTGKIAGGITLGIVALTAIFRKYGQQIKSGIQSAFSGAKQWIGNLSGRNSLSDNSHLTASISSSSPGNSHAGLSHPHVMLKDIEVSDKQLVNASDLAYKDVISENNIKKYLGEDWLEDKNLSLDLPNGLQAHVFRNRYTKEVIIAFRGTEPDTWEGIKQDLLTADRYIGLGDDRNNPQAIEARKYVEKILNNPDYQGYKIVLTGHSLGGYLATDCAARYKIPAVTFNAAGMNLFPNLNVSVLKESYEVAKQKVNPVYALAAKVFLNETKIGDQYRKNISDPEIQAIAENEKAGAYDGLIRNYRFNDDFIGSFGYRPGETYEIESDGSVKQVDDKDGLDNLDSIGWGHSMSNFTGRDKDGKKVDTPIIYDKDGNIERR